IEDAGGNRTQVFADGQLWSYEPKLSKVTLRRQGGPFGHDPSGFSLKAMARDYARWGWRDTFRLLDDTTANGRRVRRVLIEHTGFEPNRILMLVDVATGLPVQGEIRFVRDGQWLPQIYFEF